MGIEIVPDSDMKKTYKVSSDDLKETIKSLSPLLPSPDKRQIIKSDIQRGMGVILMLIDCSGTMIKNKKLEQIKDGALDFANDAILKGYSIGIIKFDSSATLVCKPTQDIAKIKGILGDLEAGGFTNLVDALSLSRRILATQSYYRGIIIITDGMPNGYGDPPASIKEAAKARKEGIVINVIGTDDAKEEFLTQLTQ